MSTTLSLDHNAPIIVDSFAGGGGASLGITLALGMSPHIAINHDYAAIEMHAMNHPETWHYTEDVWHVDPRDATFGRKVKLFWASPDCKHHSRAKGSKPVEKRIRMLAWVVVKWAKDVLPDVIMLENVMEFQDWGPLTWLKKNGRIVKKDGKPQMIPIHSRKGEIYRRWVRALEALGYKVESRVLNAADYGVPTSRKRLFVIARRDGKPIRWPAQTHSKPDKAGLVPAGMHPWRTAAECIYWDIPCPSIFLTRRQAALLRKRTGIECKRPLAPKTMWRMANGLLRYVIEANKPFIVRIGHFSEKSGEGGSFRGQGCDEPLSVVHSNNDKAIVAPVINKFYGEGGQLQSADEPLHTIPTVDRFAITPAYLVKPQHGSDHMRGGPVTQPLHTLTQHRGTAVVQGTTQPIASYITQVGHRDDNKPGRPVDEPLNTILSKEHHQLGASYLTKIGQTGGQGAYSQSVEQPVGTIVSKNQDLAVVAELTAPVIVGTGGSGYAAKPRPADKPLNVVKTDNRQAVAAAALTQFNGQSIGQPADAQLQIPHTGLIAAHVTKMRGDSIGNDAEAPLPVITSGEGAERPAGAAHAMGVSAAHITKFFGGVVGSHPEDPLSTVTAIDHNGLVNANLTAIDLGDAKQVYAELQKQVDKATFNGFRRVHRFLKKYLGKKAKLPLLTVEGQTYLITDVGMRMLKPRELLNAQFTPELAAGYTLTGSTANQVAKIGNSVCPVMSQVLVEANIPKQEMQAA